MPHTHLHPRIKDPNSEQSSRRLSHLAREAERVFRLAVDLAADMSSKGHGYGELSVGQHQVVFGASRRRDAPAMSEQGVKQLWSTVMVLASAQFKAFAVHSEPGLASVFSSRRLWSWPATPRGWTYARASMVLALHKARLQTSQPGANESAAKLRPLLENLGKWLRNEVARMPAATGYQLCWVVRLLKLLKSIDAAYFEDLTKDLGAHGVTPSGLEQRLRNRLAISLQRDSDFPEFEVADMATILGGRYLNPTAQANPANRSLYSRAVRYVLRGRQPGTESWRYEFKQDSLQGNPGEKEVLRQALSNPLASASDYSPLAFALDLPNSVLLPCLKTLSNTAEGVLGALKWKLESYASAEDRFKGVIDLADMNRAVYDGVLIGASVSDRLKDLLSDAEMNALGAEVPTTSVPWGKLSDSLQFRNNLEKGVLDLWKNRSPERPGAILVFGPPGTGKTIIAASLLNELNRALRDPKRHEPFEEWRFLALSPADFARDGSDKIIASAEALFQRLQHIRRCVVLLDEMEEFLRARGPGSTEEGRLITTAFLPLLQETVDRREIILIVATNFVGTIDSAVTRRGRFDLILPLGPPAMESREDIITDWLKEEHEAIRAQTPSGAALIRASLALVVTYTRGYTWAEIRDFLQELWRSNTITDEQTLKYELWRIRQEKVPMALSGNPGCNWRTFRDETARFRRPAAGLSSGLEDGARDPKDPEYWDEPEMPKSS